MWRKPPSASVSRLVPCAYKSPRLFAALSLPTTTTFPPSPPPVLFLSPYGLWPWTRHRWSRLSRAQQPPSTGTSNGSRWLELAASAMVYRLRQPPRQYSITLLTDTPEALWDNASATRCRLLGGWYSTSTTDPDWPHFRHRTPWQQSSVCSISFLHDDYMARLDTPLVVDQ